MAECLLRPNLTTTKKKIQSQEIWLNSKYHSSVYKPVCYSIEKDNNTRKRYDPPHNCFFIFQHKKAMLLTPLTRRFRFVLQIPSYMLNTPQQKAGPAKSCLIVTRTCKDRDNITRPAKQCSSGINIALQTNPTKPHES